MTNIRIREALKESGMKQWQLAELMQLNEFSLSRKFRHELPEAEQNQIIAIIESATTAQ